jgi:hypothetical protein
LIVKLVLPLIALKKFVKKKKYGWERMHLGSSRTKKFDNVKKKFGREGNDRLRNVWKVRLSWELRQKENKCKTFVLSAQSFQLSSNYFTNIGTVTDYRSNICLTRKVGGLVTVFIGSITHYLVQFEFFFTSNILICTHGSIWSKDIFIFFRYYNFLILY